MLLLRVELHATLQMSLLLNLSEVTLTVVRHFDSFNHTANDLCYTGIKVEFRIHCLRTIRTYKYNERTKERNN